MARISFTAPRKRSDRSTPITIRARSASRSAHARPWQLAEIRFYTGIHRADMNEQWHRFWAKKLAQMGRQGVKSFTRELRYQKAADGSFVAQEKGIDVRIALDVVAAVLENRCDVALIFSQDQDLSELADEIRKIARRESRWIKIASAYPVSSTYLNTRGILKTDWIQIDQDLYDKCRDPRDYR